MTSFEYITKGKIKWMRVLFTKSENGPTFLGHKKGHAIFEMKREGWIGRYDAGVMIGHNLEIGEKYSIEIKVGSKLVVKL